jgi:hypothetical protein
MHFISLGPGCQVAWQLNKNGLRKHAFPFDWLIARSIPFIKLAMCEDLRDFFTDEQIFINPIGEVMHRQYRFVFTHDLDQGYANAAEKFEFLVGRYLHCTKEDTTFVRADACPYEEWTALADFLRSKYGPQVQLVGVSNDPPAGEKHPGLRLMQADVAPMTDQLNTKYDASWTRMFEKLGWIEEYAAPMMNDVSDLNPTLQTNVLVNSA